MLTSHPCAPLAPALLAGLASALHAQSILPGSTFINPANGHTYALLTASSWSDAEAFAQGQGGHLADINDGAEQVWIADRYSGFGGVPRDLWIGLTDEVTEGTFVWSSGAPVTFTDWNPGEPNNGNGQPPEEHYAILLFELGSWNDGPDDPGVHYPGVEIFGVIEVASPVCAGDATGDGAVNFADLNAVLDAWGSAGPEGDVHPAPEGDGAVNFADLNLVLDQWGTTCP